MGSHDQALTVWGIVKGHMDSVLGRALAQAHVNYDNSVVKHFRQSIEHYLEGSLSNVSVDSHVGQRLHAVHEEIQGAVERAVNVSILDVNIQDVSMNNSDITSTSLLSVKDLLVRALDSQIETDVMNTVLTNTSGLAEPETDFFHNLPIKDETMFVVLLTMGVIIPIIFISLLVCFLYKRHKQYKKRRHEMLLSDQTEFSMEVCGSDIRPRSDLDVPDLSFKPMRM